MQYINPIGEIGLIKSKDYNGDINYKNTVLFADRTSQENYFATKATRLSRYQYNKDRSSFNVGLSINEVSKYSYLYFENGENNVFERKRYYAFITDIKYINNTTTEISFVIDLMQTFMFDIDVGRCLVEREHTITDNLFEHIIPENIAVDETICTHEMRMFTGRMLCGIILNTNITSKTIEYNGASYTREFNRTFAPPFFQDGGVVGGIPNTLYWYTGIPVTAKDVTHYRNNLSPLDKTVDTQSLYYYSDDDDVPLTEGQYSYPQFFTASQLLYDIINGNLRSTDGVLSEDNIVSVYIYPEEASNIYKKTEAQELGYNLGVSAQTFSEREIGEFKSLYDGGSYSPKNNKLYTYPYSYLEVINNEGQSGIYKLENFDHNRIQEPYKYSFRVIWSYIDPVCVVITPINYDGDDFSYEQSLTFTGLPQPYYSGNSLNQYLQQNSAKRQASLISTALSTAVGKIASLYSGNPLPYISSVVGSISAKTELKSTIEDLKNTPPQSYSIFNTEYLNTALNRCGFVIKVKNIRGELAEQIDTYFTMYGYKINRLKEPNVFRYLKDNSEHIRPSFNYLKTNNVVVKSNSPENEMLDSETRSNIAKILDSGITFWNDNSYVGNYNRENSAPI